MALKLYRRHRKECEGGNAEDACSGEFEEGRRGWKKCGCLIHASGSLRGTFKRKSTGRTDWDEAKAIALEWEKAGLWNGEVVIPTVVADLPALPKRTTIERAAKIFLDELREHAAAATHKKYRLLLNRFKTFSEQRGYVMIDQWEPLDVREFRSSWKVSPGTAVRNMAMLKLWFANIRPQQSEQQVMGDTFAQLIRHSRQEWPRSSSSILACSASASNSAICRRISAISRSRDSRDLNSDRIK